ncbi:MAG: metal ABC transporter substrate-binding protein [Gemmatimonadaceae bacterium]
MKNYKMKNLNFLRTAAAASFAFAIAAPAGAQLKVVATTPDFAAIAREIGGRAVNVTSLAKPTEDPHFVDAKPSHIVTLNRADVLIDGGAELELGWLPPLLESARNSKIGAGAPGRVVGSEGIRLIEIPTSFDRSKGDVHSLGNPHFMVDPVAVKTVAANIASHFAAVDQKNAAMYRSNLGKFNATVDAKLADWQKQLAPYRGSKIVTYHKDFGYLANRFGLQVVETLEPKPGIAPSPAHLAQVIGVMRAGGVKIILVQSFQNRKTAETVARQTGAAVLDTPQQPGALPNTGTYFQQMDNLVKTIANGLAARK